MELLYKGFQEVDANNETYDDLADMFDIRLISDQILSEYSSNSSNMEELIHAIPHDNFQLYLLMMNNQQNANLDQLPALKEFIENIEQNTDIDILDCYLSEVMYGVQIPDHTEDYQYYDGFNHLHFCLKESPNAKLVMEDGIEYTWEENCLYLFNDTDSRHSTKYETDDGGSRIILIFNISLPSNTYQTKEEKIANITEVNQRIKQYFYGSNTVNSDTSLQRYIPPTANT